jgi:hypothetical protein
MVLEAGNGQISAPGAWQPGPQFPLPRPGEPLRDQVLGQLPVTDIEQHDPQTVIAGGLAELRLSRNRQGSASLPST